MASGRGGGEDRRQEALGVACGGSGRHRARHPGAEPAGQTGRQTASTQAAEEAIPGAARYDHRQACQIFLLLQKVASSAVTVRATLPLVVLRKTRYERGPEGTVWRL